jgi:hypothetical protein
MISKGRILLMKISNPLTPPFEKGGEGGFEWSFSGQILYPAIMDLEMLT